MKAKTQHGHIGSLIKGQGKGIRFEREKNAWAGIMSGVYVLKCMGEDKNGYFPLLDSGALAAILGAQDNDGFLYPIEREPQVAQWIENTKPVHRCQIVAILSMAATGIKEKYVAIRRQTGIAYFRFDLFRPIEADNELREEETAGLSDPIFAVNGLLIDAMIWPTSEIAEKAVEFAEEIMNTDYLNNQPHVLTLEDLEEKDDE